MAIDRKRLLSGGNATVAVLAVLGVLVLLNAISDKRFKRWDWTGSQIYSLSDKTTKILAGLKADVAATVLLQPSDPVYDEIHELLANYQAKSPHLKVEYLDPSRQPARVEEIIKTFGLGRGDRTAIVFSSGERHRHITTNVPAAPTLMTLCFANFLARRLGWKVLCPPTLTPLKNTTSAISIQSIGAIVIS